MSHDSQGSIGVLDATTKEYSTIMRSHIGLIQCVDMTTEHLISCSKDGTIRIWDVLLMTQVCVCLCVCCGVTTCQGVYHLVHHCLPCITILLCTLLLQLYDFRAVGEIPCCVRCHPKQNIFTCGFESGCVQLFDIKSSLMEYRLASCVYMD